MEYFNEWYEYMLENGYIGPSLNKSILGLAFEAGRDFGEWQSENEASEKEGTSLMHLRPFWHKGKK